MISFPCTSWASNNEVQSSLTGEKVGCSWSSSTWAFSVALWRAVGLHICSGCSLWPNVPGLQCATLGVVWMAVQNLCLFPVDHVHLVYGMLRNYRLGHIFRCQCPFVLFHLWSSVRLVCPMYALLHCTRDCLSVQWGQKQTRTFRGVRICRMDSAKWRTYDRVMLALGLSRDGGGKGVGGGLQLGWSGSWGSH